jgi:D-alanine-D-alanine ligase
MVNKIKIAILRGGGNFDHTISMDNGISILKNLSEDKYIVYDIVLSKDGNWYINGKTISPEKLFRQIDLVFNTIKTNGHLEKIMDSFGVKYVGSDSFSASLVGNKIFSKKIYEKNGIKTPYYKLVRKDNYEEKDIIKIFKDVPTPYVVKPALGDSSFNINVVETVNDLKKSIEKLFEITDLILIEEYIKGKEITCCVVDNFRNKSNYSFIPVEIIYEGKIFDSISKISKHFDVVSPRLNIFEKENIQRIALESHNLLGTKYYSHSDFIIHPKRGIYILETNNIPDLRQNSHLSKSIELVGLNTSEFLDHLIVLTLKNNLPSI